MAGSENDAAKVIESYRRRRARWVPLVVGGVAILLLALGIFFLVLWLTGDREMPLPALGATDTPVPTETITPPPPSNTPTVTLTPTVTVTPTPEGPQTHIVELGESLWTIAEQYETSVDLLIAVNNLEDPNNVPVGTELIIPGPDAELPTETPLPEGLRAGDQVVYRVKPGDTLSSIAERFFTTAEAIAEENELEDLNNIGIGTELTITVGATPTPTLTPRPATRTPTPGS
jgi:LysM repeat protein